MCGNALRSQSIRFKHDKLLSQRMRVKVRLGTVGLVIPVPKPTEKVEDLISLIGLRFESHGIKPGELRIAQLSTSEGYIINRNDVIKDAVADGECLIATDYSDWVKEELVYFY